MYPKKKTKAWKKRLYQKLKNIPDIIPLIYNVGWPKLVTAYDDLYQYETMPEGGDWFKLRHWGERKGGYNYSNSHCI